MILGGASVASQIQIPLSHYFLKPRSGRPIDFYIGKFTWNDNFFILLYHSDYEIRIFSRGKRNPTPYCGRHRHKRNRNN